MARTAEILVLVILGHVFLMAADADAAEARPRSSLHVRVAAAEVSGVCPSHAASCFTVLPGVDSTSLPLPLDRAGAPFADDLPRRVASRRTDTVSAAHPPDVLRALLQVYRI